MDDARLSSITQLASPETRLVPSKCFEKQAIPSFTGSPSFPVSGRPGAEGQTVVRGRLRGQSKPVELASGF